MVLDLPLAGLLQLRLRRINTYHEQSPEWLVRAREYERKVMRS
jgi:hypothetical protein